MNNAALSNQVIQDIETAKQFRDNSKSQNTLRAYASRWSKYKKYCEDRSLDIFSEGAAAAYIGFRVTAPIEKPVKQHSTAPAKEEKKVKGCATSTLTQIISAIKYNFHNNGFSFDSSKVLEIVAGVKRYDIGREQDSGNLASRDKRGVRQVKALSRADLSVIVEAVEADKKTPYVKKCRDIALLLVGFAGAFRRSELAGLRREDIKECSYNGRRCYQIELKQSKTDQFGKGQFKTIFEANDKRLCPVRALDLWFEAAGMHSGYNGSVFVSIHKGGAISSTPINGHCVAYTLKQLALKADIHSDISGHSLRRGFVTTAFELGATDNDIMTQTGHKTLSMLQRYKESRNSIEHNAACGIL